MDLGSDHALNVMPFSLNFNIHQRKSQTLLAEEPLFDPHVCISYDQELSDELRTLANDNPEHCDQIERAIHLAAGIVCGSDLMSIK